jgi:hypothetical protein
MIDEILGNSRVSLIEDSGLKQSHAADLSRALARELRFDPFWVEALHALQDRHSPGDSVVAPNEFLHFFDKIYPLHIRRAMIPNERIDWFLLHKGMPYRVDPTLVEEAFGLFAHFANEVFVLFGRRRDNLPHEQKHHLQPVLDWRENSFAEVDGHAALVTTFERPNLLEPCLQSIDGQFDHILVVDDGSEGMSQDRHATMARQAGAEYVHLGRNRGYACALNVGITMLLADLDIAWISAFNDDTVLVSRGIERLKSVTHARGTASQRHLYSGYASPHHLVHQQEMIQGEKVLICRSCSAQHMHAHRSYWQSVLPVPTTYARAPKSTGGIFAGQGSDADWWCSNWAPRSAIKSAGSVYVLPGLVRNNGADRSTWSSSGD